MNTYTLHRYLGYLLILPVTLWALTGAFFLVKPGYENAYEQLQVTTYPLNSTIQISPKQNWQEIAINRSILGKHYRVKIDNKWQHINPVDNQAVSEPRAQNIVNLLQDAVKHNPDRYGLVLDYKDGIAMTDTNVKLMFDWSRLTLRQQGADSRIFNTMYDIHYLRWTGNKTFDQWFGYIGLGLLVLMALTGVVMIKRTSMRAK
ncbi:PepSY domain-containing protein [Moritella sp. 24]|uniref:PepSY domain-containing protein n=1 Tax=Moritella sp. 24 TaxID=2746230 RepID=UPI001BAE121F|nr:PepSY domain-containing protein [Moritella sp. 24]QUM75192.1 PepSY domain-containing protein [Moritella sp. 24]